MLFQAAGRSLGLEVLGPITPYLLRHAGASWEFGSGLRTLSEVQRRGRWRAPLSVLARLFSFRLWFLDFVGAPPRRGPRRGWGTSTAAMATSGKKGKKDSADVTAAIQVASLALKHRKSVMYARSSDQLLSMHKVLMSIPENCPTSSLTTSR